MSSNFSPQSPIRPMSVGNVVSAGLRLYRSHLKTYLNLALYASLWSLVPIYGWAKASAISGLISRLAFGELINQPESVGEARARVNPRLWKFLLTGILVGLIFFGTLIGFYIILTIILAILFGLGAISPTDFFTLGIIGFLSIIAFVAGLTWIYGRLIIAEVPLAVEKNLSSTATIGRSWELTKGFVGRIQLIILVAFLISLPLLIVTQILSYIAQLILATFFPSESANFTIFTLLVAFALGLLSNIFIMPFWQAIKAVIYYDLRSRREGLGLQLRDRPR